MAETQAKQSFWGEIATHFISGGVSGAVSALTFQPLDVIKTRMQKLTPLGVSSSAPSMRPNTLSMAKSIFAQDGLKGLWRGTEPTLIRIVPGAGLYFLTINTLTKLLVTPEQPKLGGTQAMFVGAVSRTFVTFLLSPVAVVKTRFEAGDVQYKNTIQAMRLISRTEGVRALYSGLVPTVMRDSPYAGIQFFVYNTIRNRLSDSKTSGPFNSIKLSDPVVNMTSGFAGGFIATLATHPFDVLKAMISSC
eukprot:TRINITY_DN2779_c0_g1_i6.p1 TRINITY_DN2779_c0_g1~~TRINITY_DN2779_c0_g1_i6.p1  ORF type:complete len:248 (+),score=49.73 TRINITY_DN2779_c0_g1_i6:51-794(+)